MVRHFAPCLNTIFVQQGMGPARGAKGHGFSRAEEAGACPVALATEAAAAKAASKVPQPAAWLKPCPFAPVLHPSALDLLFVPLANHAIIMDV